MIDNLFSLAIRDEQDVVTTRQRAREIAILLGFDSHDQTRIATAVSEIARSVHQNGSGGLVTFAVDDDRLPSLRILVSGVAGDVSNHLKRELIPDGDVLAHVSAKRLMDSFELISDAAGIETVIVTKELPRNTVASVYQNALLRAELARHAKLSPLEEIKQQNQELTSALNNLRLREIELGRLNQELEETNRGVLALYAELDARADYLKRISDMKSLFLSNMSHEFRTPLSSILSLTRILLDRMDGELTAEQEKQVQFIRSSAQSLSELINDLLDLAKIELGKTPLQITEFSLASLFNSLRTLFKPILAEDNITLVIENPEAFPPLCSDESKMAQILRNLISNAVKFTKHGEVRVSASLDADGMVKIMVADTGVGIAAEDQERIFDEFVQIENNQGKTKGTGLGLPLSLKLARLFGGDLTVNSSTDNGSIFVLTLPLDYSKIVQT